MISKHPIPILEYDDTKEALIHAPNLIQKQDVGAHCVIVFFQEVIDQMLAENRLTKVFEVKSEVGKHPIYQLIQDGQKVVLFHPGIGGPFAVAFIEEIMAIGCTKFIACGGAGALNKDLAVGSLIVPTRALRAEGASYHYLPPSRYVEIDPLAVRAITDVLTDELLPFVCGMTWTTDAFYRETREMIEYRKQEGCLTVEMECASFAAAAQFRGATFGQILYGGDSVAENVWDSRAWSRHEIRRRLIDLSIKACLKL